MLRRRILVVLAIVFVLVATRVRFEALVVANSPYDEIYIGNRIETTYNVIDKAMLEIVQAENNLVGKSGDCAKMRDVIGLSSVLLDDADRLQLLAESDFAAGRFREAIQHTEQARTVGGTILAYMHVLGVDDSLPPPTRDNQITS